MSSKGPKSRDSPESRQTTSLNISNCQGGRTKTAHALSYFFNRYSIFALDSASLNAHLCTMLPHLDSFHCNVRQAFALEGTLYCEWD
jgi:hypothetical protein